MGKGTSGFSHKNNEDLYKLGSILGVDSSPFQEEDTGSQGHFDTEGFTEAVEKAAANNYDFRRSLEAANLAGEEGLPKGIGSIEDAYEVHKWMKGQHMGGGKYSSSQDMANITDRWVNEDRKKLQETFTSDLNGLKDSLLEQALGEKKDEEDENKEIVYSSRLGDSRSRLETAASNPYNLYRSNNDNVSKTDERADASRNFFDERKISLASGMNLQNDVFNNLTNAANTVTNIYGR